MNKEGTARAKTQPADLALDVASGARASEGEARAARSASEGAFEIWIQTRARTRGEGFGREGRAAIDGGRTDDRKMEGIESRGD